MYTLLPWFFEFLNSSEFFESCCSVWNFHHTMIFFNVCSRFFRNTHIFSKTHVFSTDFNVFCSFFILCLSFPWLFVSNSWSFAQFSPDELINLSETSWQNKASPFQTPVDHCKVHQDTTPNPKTPLNRSSTTYITQHDVSHARDAYDYSRLNSPVYHVQEERKKATQSTVHTAALRE